MRSQRAQLYCSLQISTFVCLFPFKMGAQKRRVNGNPDDPVKIESLSGRRLPRQHDTLGFETCPHEETYTCF